MDTKRLMPRLKAASAARAASVPTKYVKDLLRAMLAASVGSPRVTRGLRNQIVAEPQSRVEAVLRQLVARRLVYVTARRRDGRTMYRATVDGACVAGLSSKELKRAFGHRARSRSRKG